MSSCTQCSQVDTTTLPTLPCDEPVAAACPDEDAVASTPSTGCKLDSCLTDPRDLNANEGMTLLGRVGSTLTRFKENGWIELRNGLAYVVATPALKVRDIWANWVKSTPYAVPKIGDPHPFPYSVAVDPNGCLHALGGLLEHDGIQVHNKEKNQWEVIPVASLPIQTKATLPQSVNGIELVGFEETGVLASTCGKVRDLKALGTSGIVYLEKVPATVCLEDGGDPCQETAFAYVATTLEDPDTSSGQTYKLTFSASGMAWTEEV